MIENVLDIHRDVFWNNALNKKNHLSAMMKFPAFNVMSCLQAHYIIIKSDKEYTMSIGRWRVRVRNTFKYL